MPATKGPTSNLSQNGPDQTYTGVVAGQIGDQSGNLLGVAGNDAGKNSAGVLWGEAKGYTNSLGARGEVEGSLIHVGGESDTPVGKLGGSVDFGNVGAEGHIGALSAGASGEATLLKVKGNWETSQEKPVYIGANGEAKLLTAEAKVDYLLGTDGRRTGIGFGAGAEAATAKGDIEGQGGIKLPIPFTDYSFTLGAKVKAGASAGSVGAGGHVGVFHDQEDGKIHATIGGELAALVGLELDLDIMFGLVADTPSTPPTGVGIPMTPGSITTGCPSVLIGDLASTVAGKKMRYEARKKLIEEARNNADNLSPQEREKNLAAANRLERNNKAIERARLSKMSDNYEDKRAGFAYAVYESQYEEPSKPVLVFKGTETSNASGFIRDFRKANIPQGIGLETDQYNQSINLGRKLSEKYPQGFEVTGHSKAGGQAAAVGIITEQKTYTFNSAGVHENTVGKYGKSPDAASQINSNGEPLVDAYNFEHDVLSNTQDTAVPWTKVGLIASGGVGTVAGAYAVATNAGPSASGKRHVLKSVDENGKTIPFRPWKWIDFHGMPYIIDSMENEKKEDPQTLSVKYA